MEHMKKVEKLIAIMASEALIRVEKSLEKRKMPDLQDLIVLTTYLNTKILEETREEILNLERGFQRIDALIDVVKQLKNVVDSLEKTHSDSIKLLKEVNTKLDRLSSALIYTEE